jgi:dephospho-CoA kinase
VTSSASGPRRIVGLTGPNASGKSEVAAHLGRRGFAYHSLSDAVREEAARRGLPPLRDHLIEIGNELRRREGPATLARRIVPRLGALDVVDSIRNPSEVATLRELEGFRLLGVDAPIELRFERARHRGRLGDGDTLAEFRRREAAENTDDPAAQQLAATLALADARIVNGGTLEALYAEVDRLLASWGERR